MAEKSISVAKGKGSIAHNNRKFIHDNVDQERTPDNVIYKQEPIEEAYENCFGNAIKDYNEKQMRNDRKIDGVKGYMEQIKTSGNGEKLFYENIIQIGNMNDTHVKTPAGVEAKQILDKYMRDFQAKNPNLYMFNAVMHLDEQTPHLHIDYIPIARGYQRGIQVRNSLDKALKQQGVDGRANKKENSTMRWQEVEKDRLGDIMLSYGLKRAEDKGLEQKHLTVDQYKAITKKVHAEVNELPIQIDSAPIFMHKQRVTVDKADLEQLERRAKLSLVHEKNTKKLFEDSKNLVKDTQQYVNNKMSMALMYQSNAEQELEKASEKHQKAMDLKDKSQKIHDGQLEINNRYNKLYQTYKEQKQTITDLRTENTTLRGQISDLRHSFEEKVQHAMEPLKVQIENLTEKIKSMALGEVTLMKSMRYVEKFFSGEVSGEILNSAYHAGNQFLKEDGFEDLMNPDHALPTSVRKQMSMVLSFQKGDEGLGVYSPNGTCVMNCKNFGEAKECFPNCTIKNMQRSQDLSR